MKTAFILVIFLSVKIVLIVFLLAIVNLFMGALILEVVMGVCFCRGVILVRTVCFVKVVAVVKIALAA